MYTHPPTQTYVHVPVCANACVGNLHITSLVCTLEMMVTRVWNFVMHCDVQPIVRVLQPSDRLILSASARAAGGKAKKQRMHVHHAVRLL